MIETILKAVVNKIGYGGFTASIVFLSCFFSFYLNWRTKHDESSVENAKKVSEMSREHAEQLQKAIDELRATNKELDGRIKCLERKFARIEQVIELDGAKCEIAIQNKCHDDDFKCPVNQEYLKLKAEKDAIQSNL